jgi:hypothetical protein
MITDKELAKEVDVILRGVFLALDRSAALVRRESEEEAAAYVAAVGKSSCASTLKLWIRYIANWDNSNGTDVYPPYVNQQSSDPGSLGESLGIPTGIPQEMWGIGPALACPPPTHARSALAARGRRPPRRVKNGQAPTTWTEHPQPTTW